MENKRERIIEITNLVIAICLLFGTEIKTAYAVGAAFAQGLEGAKNGRS